MILVNVVAGVLLLKAGHLLLEAGDGPLVPPLIQIALLVVLATLYSSTKTKSIKIISK